MLRKTTLVAAASVLLVTSAAAEPDRAADRQAITTGESAWGGAFVTGDVAAAERLLAPDFSGTGSDGARYDKASVLKDLRKGPSIAANATTVVSIRFIGEAAVVQGEDAVVDLAPGGKRHTQAWTDVWVRRQGRWQVFSAQDTPIKAKP